MDACQWEKVRKNHDLILKDLDAGHDVIPYLFKKEVFDLNTNRELSEKLPVEAQTKLLLEKLKELPQDKNAYPFFLEALKFSKYDWIAEKIEKTETISDPSVRSKTDPSHCEPHVRTILDANFANRKGESTSIDDIRNVLNDNKAFATGGEWSNATITKCVMDHFVGLEKFDKIISAVPKRKKLCFRHLVKIVSPSPAPDVVGARCAEDTEQEKDGNVDIQTLSPIELKTFLLKEFENEKISTGTGENFLNEIVNEDINGKIFLTLSENDIKEVFQSTTFGQRKLIKFFQDRYRHIDELSEHFETFRPFDKEVEPTDCYAEGKCVDTTIQTRAKKTMPIRNFHLPEFKSDDDTMNYILVECAIFTAACINERRNGTIYFGISPSDSDGKTKGQVVGLNLPITELDYTLLSMFFLNQRQVIKNTLRNARSVPVIRKSGDSVSYVIEFDVVPGVLESEDECIKINASNLPHLFKSKKWKVRDPIYEFSEMGIPRLRTANETSSNSKVAASSIAQRQDDERKALNQATPNVTQLRNHLTGGCDKMDVDLYTFLLLGPVTSKSINLNNLAFIKHLQPEVVFDFDPHTDDSNGIYDMLDEEQEEVMKVVTLDDFDEQQKSEEKMETFQSQLAKSRYINWLFCNGYGDMIEMKVSEWKKERMNAFQTAFEHYVKKCCKDRVLIVICLFSPEYEVMLPAFLHVLQKLPVQWILLSETENVAKSWQLYQNKLVGINIIEKSDIKGRSIIGLSWEQVNSSITSWCRKGNSFGCEIPDSSGVLVKVENKKINEWRDVEVLSSLDPVNPDEDEVTSQGNQKKAEEKFYSGGEVEWLNFFCDHVCKRKIHEELNVLILAALEGNNSREDEKVLKIYLCHEPGAGGSTSARQILWSLRERYRCCLVREITNQTADQLTELFFFKEESPNSPKPLLVLIDNEDEDKLSWLIKKLGAKAYEECICGIFCVLLICYRAVSVPGDKRNQSIVTLKQFLDKQDLNWFNVRYGTLKSRYNNPKSLISFNILKENFNKEYIQNTVTEFMDEIKDKNEETILKYVSLINYFDSRFKPINVSCFDFIFESGQMFKSGMNWKRGTTWEANVSGSFKVLLNLSSNQIEKKRKAIRLFNKLTAEHILNYIRAKTNESVSDIIRCVMTTNIFYGTGQAMQDFQNIISDMFKDRAQIFEKGFLRREKFAPIILYIKEIEGIDKAGEIMKELFELTMDPHTAQQIARFHYIASKNYMNAEEYASKATRILPWNSFVHDTYAQVFRAQFIDKVQSASQLVEGRFSDEEIKELIPLCEKSIKLFRKVQELSENEKSNHQNINLAGYYGELKSIIGMLEAIEKHESFHSLKVIQDFLTGGNYPNKNVDFLSMEETKFLRQLWNAAKDIIQKLDDTFLQMAVKNEANPFSHDHDRDKKQKLAELRVKLNHYFGESSDEIPSYLEEEDKCMMRSRIVFSKKAYYLFETLHLVEKQEFGVLRKCYELMLENSRSEHRKIEDISCLLNIVTACLTSGTIPPDLERKHLIGWSNDLYCNLPENDDGSYSLHPFMYFLLFNFPTEERQNVPSLEKFQELNTVLERWEKNLTEKTKKQKFPYKRRNLFFLGKRTFPFDIVYLQKVEAMSRMSQPFKKWHQPEMYNLCKVLYGILKDEGNLISYSFKTIEGNQKWINIKTSTRITKAVWYRKKVYFYLEFSLSGLKAHGVTDKHPDELQNPPRFSHR